MTKVLAPRSACKFLELSRIVRCNFSAYKWTITPEMNQLVYLSLGSNIGDRQSHLRKAVAILETLGRVVSVSSFTRLSRSSLRIRHGS